MTTCARLCLASFLVGCAPGLVEGRYACTTDDECPPTWSCVDQRCFRSARDAGGTDARTPDAQTLDGARPDAGPDSGPCIPPPSGVDLLVLVDNSGSMAEEQASLITALPQVVNALATGDADGDGRRDFLPVNDLHVGVISSDMGTRPHTIEIANCPGAGDDGILIDRHRGVDTTCREIYPTFLSYQPGGALAEFRADFTCLASLGTGGCALEQQLDAVLKAVTPSTSDVRFYADERGHGDGANGGFLRRESLLVVLVVTDEDDCSAVDPDIFNIDSTTYPQNISVRCAFAQEALHPIARYADGLRALRPDHPERVIFAALTGVPVDLEQAPYTQMLEDRRLQFTEDPDRNGRLVPSCSVEGRGAADPPRRYIELARELDEGGSGSVIASICQADYGGAMRRLLSEITPLLVDTCE